MRGLDKPFRPIYHRRVTRPTSRFPIRPSTANGPQAEEPSGRERILDAALEVIARRGYSAAGVQEIVDLSATSKGSFYFHFPSKEQMVMALVERMSEKLINKVRDTVKNQPTPLHRVAGSIDVLMTTFARQHKVAQVLLLSIVGNGKAVDKKFLPIRERFSGLIREELDAAIEAGQIEPMDTQLVARIWVGGLHEVILHWLMTGQPNPLTSASPALRRTLLLSVGADPATIEAGPGMARTQ
ncbi:MAG: TetR/AcrR family transcriptional regulator [bacterium]|nr:TetR/AcrR family transcriptional regulator [bacterium]